MSFIPLKNSTPLPPTKKLWIDEPYRTSSEATVLYVQDNLVVFDQTVFYAESGGQVADQGWIDDVPVCDVQKLPGIVIYITLEDGRNVPPVQINTVVVHKLDCSVAPFEVGQKVQMKINWELRYLHMRYHSAAHFVLDALKEVYDKAEEKLYLKGCYIYSESARFDFANRLDPNLIPEVSTLTNEFIAQNGDIIMEPDPSTKEISYWRYGNIIIPCGGTHVIKASEVGSIKIKRSRHGKTTDRVYLTLEDVKPAPIPK
jgi:alanyl-tRNA synthetase